MLNKHNWTDFILIFQFMGVRYAKDTQYITIIGDNVMMLSRVSVCSYAITLVEFMNQNKLKYCNFNLLLCADP